MAAIRSIATNTLVADSPAPFSAVSSYPYLLKKSDIDITCSVTLYHVT
jgi:hypothetical protein